MDDYKKIIKEDTDGSLSYEHLVNNIDELSPEGIKELLSHIKRVDSTGQYTVSAARYLHSVNPETHASLVGELIEAAIGIDRERRYIGTLLAAVWGDDYREHAAELSATDNNFRRIYKRIHDDRI